MCQAGGVQDSFLCPNGTIWNQEKFACQWWYEVGGNLVFYVMILCFINLCLSFRLLPRPLLYQTIIRWAAPPPHHSMHWTTIYTKEKSWMENRLYSILLDRPTLDVLKWNLFFYFVCFCLKQFAFSFCSFALIFSSRAYSSSCELNNSI